MAKRLDTRLDRLERRRGRQGDFPALFIDVDADVDTGDFIGWEGGDQLVEPRKGETKDQLRERLASGPGVKPLYIARYAEQEAETLISEVYNREPKNHENPHRRCKS